MANRFLNNITINDEYTLPAADGTADQIIVTDGAGNLSFVDTTTISVGESEQVHIACKNTSGVAISKGDPVYITGTVGTSFRVEIAVADASNSAKMPAVGLAQTDLAINAEGYVVVSGVLKNLTTDPLSTGDGTPSSNDTVYVKAGGGLTRTKPTGSSNLIQNVGKVGRVNSANAGSIAVSTIMRTNDVPNLTTGKIWVGSSTYTTESGVVHLDEGNSRMGINTTSPSQALTVEGNIELGTGGYIYGDTTTPAVRLNSSVGSYLQYGTGSYVGVGSNVVTFRTSSSEHMRINSSGNVGIGTTSPAGKLEINGGTGVATSGGTLIVRQDGDAGTDGIALTSSNSISHRIWKDVNGKLNIGPSTSLSALVQDLSGNVGIGTNSPSVNLHVESSTSAQFKVGNGTQFVRLYADADEATILADGSVDMRFYTGGSEKMRINTSGNVGIGNTSPGYHLSVNGAVQTDMVRGYTYPTLSYLDFDDDDLPNGNSVSLTSVAGMAFVIDSNNNATTDAFYWKIDGTTATGSTIMTLADEGSLQLNNYGSGTFTGTATQRLGVDSSGNVIEIPIGSGPVDGSGTANYVTKWTDADTIGNSIIYDNGTDVGIGTTSPTYTLHVNGDAKVGTNLSVNNTFGNKGTNLGINFESPSTALQTARVDSDAFRFYFGGTGGGGEVFRILEGGNVGIGTTSPSAKLDSISPDGNTNSLRLGRSDNSNYWDFNHAGNDLRIYNTAGTNSDILFGVNSGGAAQGNKVGIGTATPAYPLDVTGNVRLTGDLYVNGGQVETSSIQARVKYSVWSGTTYGIGMQSSYNYGHLNNDYAMTFQMNSDDDRGFWWGDNSHSNSQGAMSLSTNGKATIATSLSVGEGESITSPSDKTLYVAGDSVLDKKSILRLPAMSMGSGSITDEYLVIARKYDGSNQNATGIIGKIVFSRGSTGMGNNPSEYYINIQCAYNGNALNNLTYTGTEIFTSLDVIDISGTDYYALKVRTSGGGETSNRFYAEGLLMDDGDSNMFTRVRSSDASVTVVSTGAMTPTVQVDGSGAANQVAFWTDADTISGENNLYWDSTNDRLGIQVTPSQPLDVNGTALIRNTIYVGDDIQHWGDGGTGMFFGTDTISLKNDGGSTRLFVESGGNVGIGTTSPSAKLHIEGDGSIIRLQNNNSDTNGTFIDFRDSTGTRTGYVGTTGTSDDMFLFTQGAKPIRFYTNALERVRIDSSGNVGIGTTSASSPLAFGKSVYGNFDSENFYRIKLQDQGGVHNDVGIGQTASGSMGFNVTNGGAFIFNGGTGGEIARFNNTGLGIGTTSPSVELQVGDGTADSKIRALFSDNTYTQIAGYGLDFSRGYSYLRPTVATTKNLYIGQDVKAWSTINSYAANNFVWSDGSTELMRLISSTGRLGIGTTSPSNKLEIYTTSASENVFSISNGTQRLQLGLNNSQGSFIFEQQSYALRFGTANTERMRIDSSGNVGIGTTSPTYTLDVVGAIGMNTYLYHNDDTDTFIGYSANDTFDVNAGGVKQLSVTSDNVNITDTLSYTYPAATNEYNGEIVTFGTFDSAITAGDVIVYTTAGLSTGWFQALGNTTYGKGMLGIAMGTSPSDGILIKGFARSAVFSSGVLGNPLYLSATSAGDTTNTAPSSTNNVVRIVGYMLNPTNDEIFFDPDKSWVQVS